MVSPTLYSSLLKKKEKQKKEILELFYSRSN